MKLQLIIHVRFKFVPSNHSKLTAVGRGIRQTRALNAANIPPKARLFSVMDALIAIRPGYHSKRDVLHDYSSKGPSDST